MSMPTAGSGSDATRRAPPGGATPAGTARYAARASGGMVPDFHRAFAGGLRVSSLGLGTYLGECDDAEDARYVAALRLAFARGINVVDTAINYRCQRSERAVARALADSIAAGVVRRDEVVVCTKGGFVPLDGEPPASRAEYERYVQREFVDTGELDANHLVGGGHSLEARFLAALIARSRANLGVRTIDVYYVHNPEQQLEATSPARFRTLLRHAFAMLEERVAVGDIGCYGIASWHGFRVAPEARGHLSLTELVAIAREVGGDGHHLAVVQLPVNLAMSEAIRTPTQRRGGRAVPLLHVAAELGVSVMASATLMQAQLAHDLPAAVADAFPGLRTDAQRAIAFVRSLPGVTAALVGMKRVEHVHENCDAFRA